MNSINSIVFEGNLGKDAQILKIGKKFLIKNSVAQDQFAGGKERTLWLNIELWRDSEMAAERAASVLKKGKRITVIGKLLDDSYQKGEQMIKNVKIQVERFNLAPKQEPMQEEPELEVETNEEEEYHPF